MFDMSAGVSVFVVTVWPLDPISDQRPSLG
jgi:hypothetical protein